MILTQAWTELRPHKPQFDLYTSQDRLVAVRAGRRSGKTTIAKRRIVRMLPVKLWHNQPFRGLLVSPTRDQTKRIYWSDIKALVNPSWLAEAPRESELIIRTIWGSEIHLGGFDKPQRFEGVPWDFVVVDESADIKPKSVDLSLRLAVADRQGTIWRIGVPKRVGVGAKEFNEICDNRQHGYRYFGWPAVDILPIAEINKLADELDEKDFAEQVLGQAVSVGGLAFYSFDIKTNVTTQGTAYDPSKPIIVGSDFNVDPMAWTLNHVANNSLYTFDEIWLRNTNTRDTLDKLYQRYSKHRAGWYFYGDATAQARKTAGTAASQSDYLIIAHDKRFQGARIRYPRSNPRIKDRLASCNHLLKSMSGKRRWFISPSCTHLIDDLSHRAVDDLGQPVDATKDAGHISDAAGYVVHGLFPIHLSDLQDSELKAQSPIDFQPVELEKTGHRAGAVASNPPQAHISFGVIG
jgi:hypothetical protein